MNKIKLIKSFAGYPVGEYEYYGHPNNRWNKVDLVSIHPDIVEKFKDHFEEVNERRGYYLSDYDDDGDITYTGKLSQNNKLKHLLH